MGEIARGELVREELVGRRVVGHAQQRFGERHHRQALARGEGEFVQEIFDAAKRITLGANAAHELQRSFFYDPLCRSIRTRPEKGFSEALVGRRVWRRKGRRPIVFSIHSPWNRPRPQGSIRSCRLPLPAARNATW